MMKQQLTWSLWLIRAGAGSYHQRPIHAHILVVGWLSLFSWDVYYRLFYIRGQKLAALHTYTVLIGTIGLTSGMWLEFLKPFSLPDIVTLLVYSIGGSILLLSFILFFFTTFWIQTKEEN